MNLTEEESTKVLRFLQMDPTSYSIRDIGSDAYIMLACLERCCALKRYVSVGSTGIDSMPWIAWTDMGVNPVLQEKADSSPLAVVRVVIQFPEALCDQAVSSEVEDAEPCYAELKDYAAALGVIAPGDPLPVPMLRVMKAQMSAAWTILRSRPSKEAS